MHIDKVMAGYLSCALWSSCGEDDQPLDNTYDADDIAATSVADARAEVLDFIMAQLELLEESGLDDEQIGHDFWLTRNRHGAGFWDRGLGEVGDKLTEACRPYGSSDCYVGDDGKVYLT